MRLCVPCRASPCGSATTSTLMRTRCARCIDCASQLSIAPCPIVTGHTGLTSTLSRWSGELRGHEQGRRHAAAGGLCPKGAQLPATLSFLLRPCLPLLLTGLKRHLLISADAPAVRLRGHVHPEERKGRVSHPVRLQLMCSVVHYILTRLQVSGSSVRTLCIDQWGQQMLHKTLHTAPHPTTTPCSARALVDVLLCLQGRLDVPRPGHPADYEGEPLCYSDLKH
jgi:hypothetical protein